MAKCGACGKFLATTNSAPCAFCPILYHKGCVAILESTIIPKDWACPECTKKKQRKGDNSGTPVKGVSGIQVPPLPQDASVPPLAGLSTSVLPTVTTGDQETREMRRELASYISEIREIRKDAGEIRHIRNEVTEIRSMLDDNLLRINSRLDEFDQRLGVLEGKLMAPGNSQSSDLEQQVVQLRLELNDRDQDTLLSDLDIGHLPEAKGENVQHTVTVLAAKLGITLEERDIVFAERVGTLDRGNSPSSNGGGSGGEGARGRRVVVRLARRQTRDDLLRAARVRRNITSADFGHSGPARRVYVNERLTRANRQLFQRVREECRSRHWRYSWTRRGRIYARQGDGKQAFQIRTDADLVRVFGSPTV